MFIRNLLKNRQNLKHTKSQQNLVIGGSFGIGEELVKQLVNRGDNVAIMARSKEKLDNLLEDLKGDNHLAIPCDISDHKSLKSEFSKLIKKFKQIDLIIFCVGAYDPMNLENFDLKKANQITQVNFNSFFNVIDVILPAVKKQQIKHVAITSSVAGYFGMPNSLAYGASKAALSNLTESLYYELKKYSVKTQLINPGFVKTRLTDKNNFKMPGIIDAQKAAQIIIKKLDSNKFEISFPYAFTTFMRLVKILPYKVRLFLLKNI